MLAVRRYFADVGAVGSRAERQTYVSRWPLDVIIVLMTVPSREQIWIKIEFKVSFVPP